jgi:copper(I)-binding protein
MMRKLLLLACVMTGNVLACDLKIESAWIRPAPSNAVALAGYALLTNTGSAPLSVVSAQSAAFAKVELHESLMENGIAKMRAMDKLEIASGGKVQFAPGGKHFMLISPKAALRIGDMVVVKVKDAAGCEVTANFKVGDDQAAAKGDMPHPSADHSSMKH